MEQAIRNRTAVVGLGWTPFTESSGTTVLDLALEASLNAIADAGIEPDAIDGVITSCFGAEFERQAYPREVVRGLGLTNCRFQQFEILGGAQCCTYVAAAAMAVHAGLCDNVLLFRALNRASDRGGGLSDGGDRGGGRSAGTGPPRARGAQQWTAPFGVFHPPAGFGTPFVAHMARYGTTTEDLAHVAVTQRAHALLNEKAMTHDPLTVEEHRASPWVVYPYRQLDCALDTDGAVALVITSAERAKALRHAPVLITAFSSGERLDAEPWETHAETVAPRLYQAAGITAADVSLAELYDVVSGTCLLEAEGFGLAPRGEGGTWFAEGRARLDGDVPVNTHGGLLSEAFVHGLNHVVEAVQQLRPEGVVDDGCAGPHDFDRAHCRQVRDPEVALVCGELGRSALLLARP